MPNAITATDQFLEEISGKLDKLIDLLGDSSQEPAEPKTAPIDDAPATGEPEKPAAKKAPAKKAATRKRVTGQ